MSFSDHFSVAARDYARYRPRYPKELFAVIASSTQRRRLVWDCATGNGQAAVSLAEHFDRVVATDASAKQIENATLHPRVSYRVATAEAAEASGIEDGGADAVTVAQALHWFDLDSFFGEVRRVLVSGGVFAVWSYNLLTVDPLVDAVISHYYAQVVGAYWPPERSIVEKGYMSLAFPFEEIRLPPFSMEESWDLDRLVGYLGTWSATNRAREATGMDPIQSIGTSLRKAWGDPAGEKLVRWPLAARAGRP